MKKLELVNLDTDIYTEKLPNGLEIYVVPKNNVNNIYATFTTKFGSRTNEFIPFGEKEMHKFPEGVAHFLEHKAFEQEDGIDPFSIFTKNGADCNASTDRFKTTYMFSGPTNFKENINTLLDFVQTPYFTDENVNKEKGIIAQEIEMYKDNPFREGYDKIILNTLVKNPVRYSVGGTVSSIKKITKEDLYRCYNTFYNPNNMFVVVTGNVEPKEVISIIKENQEKKKFKKIKLITTKEYDEPDSVEKEEDKLEMNVTIPKMFLSYKFNIKDFKDDDNLGLYFSIYTDLKFGPTSVFSEKMKKEGIITYDVDFSLTKIDNHMLVVFDDETNKPNELIKNIKTEYSKVNITKQDFERKKKSLLASSVYMSDNIYSLNNKIVNDIIHKDGLKNDIYDIIKNLDYDKLIEIFKNISFENTSKLVINPKQS